MTKETLLMQYQSECLSNIKSVVDIQNLLKNVHGCNEIIYGYPCSYKLPPIGQVWTIFGTDIP